MKIYISSSWKQRAAVRQTAHRLRADAHLVYDFTDPASRDGVPEIPPEQFPIEFDPAVHRYEAYLRENPYWKAAVDKNREALNNCDVAILLLPCGNDAHADAYYALGRGKRLIVRGHPDKGSRTPTHLWAEAFLRNDEELAKYLLAHP